MEPRLDAEAIADACTDMMAVSPGLTDFDLPGHAFEGLATATTGLPCLRRAAKPNRT